MLCEFFGELLEYQENLLLKYYVKHGHSVTVIASTFESVFDYYNDRHDAKAPAREYEYGGGKIIRLPYRFNLFNRLRAYLRIDKILEAERPDLIYVHDIMLNLPECVRYVKRHPKCKMILDYHADYSNSGKNWLSLKVLHGVIRKRFLDEARPYLSRIFPIVPASATFLHEVYGVPHAEMELLPLGADTDLALEVKGLGAGRELRLEMGLAIDDIVIFTGGKLAPAKQTELLLEAVIRLNNPKLHTLVVGSASATDQPYYEYLFDVARSDKNIHFVGWLSPRNIYRHLDTANLAVFPASQSILWQQAIAMGLPLIVGDTGSQSIEYLNKTDNIVILPKEKIGVHELAEAILLLVASPERLQAMSSSARRVAADYLDWNDLIAHTLQFNSSRCESIAFLDPT